MAGVKSAVQIHINRGDDLNARDAKGMTPLMLSAMRNKPTICRLLLDAGADPSLVDYTGRTAMDIALTTGAVAVAEMLKTACLPIPPLLSPTIAVLSEPSSSVITNPIGPSNVEPSPDVSIKAVAQTVLHEPAESPGPGTSSQPMTAPHSQEGTEEFNLSGWEAEEEPTRPEIDLEVLISASAAQDSITAHAPIDSSAEWDDIDTYLPETALQLTRSDDAEDRARLRRLLLRALREGSVPRFDIQDQSTNEDRSANPEAEAHLAMVINDLGAELDERFEYSNADESYEVFVNPVESHEEETAIDEALSAIDRATSPRHEPLQIYQREFTRQRLLTAEEEIQLAKNMETALDAAIHALSAWPDGIARTLAAGQEVMAGSRRRSSFLIGSAGLSPEPSSADHPDTACSTAGEAENGMSANEELEDDTRTETDDATLVDSLRQLAALFHQGKTLISVSHQIHQILTEMHLNRRFLLELTDAAKHGPELCPAFLSSMANFQRSRNHMASANLRLAFFHARKHLYSGEPLDDLAQEANIGLLRAIDHYNWRRGFRFSTYATWWIRQQLGRYIADKARTIRIPVHVYEKIQRMERMAQAFETTTGHEPTLSELSELMEMPSPKLSALLRIAPDVSYIDMRSIDNLIASDARDTYLSPDPADLVDEHQLHQAVDRFITTLSEDKNKSKEEQILRLRFGFGTEDPLTLEQIGVLLGVTRERIRQIEAKALRKLRHPARSEPFARIAFGLPLSPHSVAADTKNPEATKRVNNNPDNRTPTVQELPVVPQGPSEFNQPSRPSKPSELDRLLAQAVELGIHVEDNRPDSGRIWVQLQDTDGRTHRQLARQLLKLGFAPWPGRGYWR